MQKKQTPSNAKAFRVFFSNSNFITYTHKYPQIIVSLLFRGRLIIQETWFLLEHIKH